MLSFVEFTECDGEIIGLQQNKNRHKCVKYIGPEGATMHVRIRASYF